ncbi:lipoprotein [Vibrio phage JSF3]|uniref:Putative lipoprotein n=2 Tax=Pacinivirus VCO139 TaxID=2846607 RepID=R9R5A8_9CAUD|nr:lipoprotein [Vibrio phage JA-1]YP_009874321.1 lipoprotein [Vibrio phage VCO139]YP_009876303.1 lipoprotein [Vibrio phage JSF3]AGI61773.1 putative lipoprotein [Vibrio phage JA-1]AGI61849.1 putative lipoprotein [Vibrio phage VCO139]APD18090.1 hypothetical protein [Vibrio phage JSF3]
MKQLSLFILLFLSVFIFGCKSEASDIPRKSLLQLGFEQKLSTDNMRIYQNVYSGNCYVWNNWAHGGEMSSVPCSDFGLQTKEELELLEKQQYLKLKEKFE